MTFRSSPSQRNEPDIRANCNYQTFQQQHLTMSDKMTQSDASRIQSTQVRLVSTFEPLLCRLARTRLTDQAAGGKDMGSGGFAARAQGAGNRNSNAGYYGSGKGGGGFQGGGGTAGGQGGNYAGGGRKMGGGNGKH